MAHEAPAAPGTCPPRAVQTAVLASSQTANSTIAVHQVLLQVFEPRVGCFFRLLQQVWSKTYRKVVFGVERIKQ